MYDRYMKIKNKPLFALSILLFLSLLIICINDWQRPFFPGNEGIEIILFVFLIPPAIAFYLSVESSKSKDGISPNVIFYIPMVVGLLFYLIVRWNGVQDLEKDHKIVKGVVTHNFLRHGKGPSKK